MTRAQPKCLGCAAPLHRTVIDLGLSPLANAFVPPDQTAPDPTYPLHARLCDRCLLMQVDAVLPPADIFGDYAYFSSYSDSWLAHCRSYAATMIDRFSLSATSQVVEIASNDGYLLTNFVAAGIPCLGIEPAANVAAAARSRGVPTEIAFFGTQTAQRLADAGRRADLLAAKNVLAHVPDINDFVAGIRILLKPEGVFTVEFPHVLNLIREAQFDTIYHEHFTYLSLAAVEHIFRRHGLRVFDVEEVPTHGGSLRVFACRDESTRAERSGASKVRLKETDARIDRPEGYAGLTERAQTIQRDLLAFLNTARVKGHRVAAYGAAAKGNTLLNYCGIGREHVTFVVDRNPTKQGRLLPGSHIPVRPPDALFDERPDYVLVLPWNLIDEISTQLAPIRAWGGRLVTAIPEIRVS
jgi:SAM-dependent methyltransferase